MLRAVSAIVGFVWSLTFFSLVLMIFIPEPTQALMPPIMPHSRVSSPSPAVRLWAVGSFFLWTSSYHKLRSFIFLFSFLMISWILFPKVTFLGQRV